MSCVTCKQPLNEWSMFMVNEDGDFACSTECKQAYEKERARFFNEIVHDDKKFERWMSE